MENFWDRHNGGFVWSCDHEGKIVDPTKDAYGHAFVVLGLVYVYKATGEKRYLDKAMDVLHLLHSNFTDHYGGMIWRMSGDWKDRDENRSQNPLMHAFESMIAIFPHITDPKIKDDVKKKMTETVDFLFPGKTSDEYDELPEIYTKSWKPIPYNKGGYISVGHLFEWAFLLSEGLALGLPDTYRVIADRLMKTGLLLGYHSEKGYIKTWVDNQGNVLWDEVSWWEQSEALRALICYIMRFERMDLIKYFEKLFQFVKTRFIDHEFGGWYTSLNPDVSPRDQNKGSLWKLDYHQTGLCMEAIKYLNIP
jgi:mannose/cellobiose epimerase-like protein (N-acyl-D-glucosamine 2-epimerase family)